MDDIDDNLITGLPFTLSHLSPTDLQAGKLEISWTPSQGHHSFSQEAAKIIEQAYIDILLSSIDGAWEVTDEFNKIFPDYEFIGIDEFLGDVWKGKP